MVNRRSSHVRPVFTRLFGPFQWAVPTYLPVSLYVREGGYVIYKPSQYLSSASKPSPPWFLRACACSCARGVLSVRVITRFFPLSSHIKLRLKKEENVEHIRRLGHPPSQVFPPSPLLVKTPGLTSTHFHTVQCSGARCIFQRTPRGSRASRQRRSRVNFPLFRHFFLDPNPRALQQQSSTVP